MLNALSISVEGLDQLRSTLEKLSESLDTNAILDEASAILLSRTLLRFRQEVTPDGQSWAVLRPRTIKERLKLGYPGTNPILYRSGELFNSIQLAADGPDGRKIFTDLPKAYDLFYGNADKNLPARPFLGISDEDSQVMYALVLKRVNTALGEPNG